MRVARFVIFLLLLCLLPTLCFAWSDNISTSEFWSVRHNLQTFNQSVNFFVESLTGAAAFKITVMVYFWTATDQYLGNGRFFMPGPIFKQFGFHMMVPKGTSKITADVYNTWEYGQ